MSKNSRLTGWCRHYDGHGVVLGSGLCEAGVDVHKLCGDVPGILLRFPCRASNDVNGAPSCEKRELWTEAEVEQMELEEMETARHALKAIAAIRQSPERNGTVTCPRCGGNLHFARSLRNSHVNAACETQGCLSMME